MLLRLVMRKRPRPGFPAHLRPTPTPPSSASFSFSTRPRPAFQHVIIENGDEDENEEEGEKENNQEERTALGKALLDPAWMHGRRRIAAPPQEGIERMNDLSRLLSGKQIRLHASRMNRRGAAEEDAAKKKKKKGLNKKKGEASLEDEDEEGEWDDEDGRRKARAQAKGDDDNSDDDSSDDDDSDNEDENEEEDEEEGPIEGEGGKAGYTMLTPTWTGKVASPPEALAYLSTRAVPNFSINLRVLRDVATASSLPSSPSAGEPPRSFLDVGCGPGSGLLAAHTVWPDIERLEGVDHSGAMRDLSKHLLVGKKGKEGAKEGPGEGGKVALHRHLPPLLGQVGKTGEKYDVVFASWTLSELGSEASRAMAVAVMWELVAEEGGFLVLIEDGSSEGSRLVRSARKFVLDEQQQQQQQQSADATTERGGSESMTAAAVGGGGGGGGGGARTVGPCPHDKPCPLIKSDWCRFSQRVPIGRIQRGAGKQGLGYKDVAFSYVIMQKTGGREGGREEGVEEGDARLAALHRLRYGDSRAEGGREGGREGGHSKMQSSPFPYQPEDSDWEVAVDSPPERDGWGRLIRNPKKKKGHVYLDMCSPKGKLERIVVAKRAAKPVPGKYMAARKAQWGGLWPFPDV